MGSWSWGIARRERWFSEGRARKELDDITSAHLRRVVMKIRGELACSSSPKSERRTYGLYIPISDLITKHIYRCMTHHHVYILYTIIKPENVISFLICEVVMGY